MTNVIYLQQPSIQVFVILNLFRAGLHKHSHYNLETRNLKNTVHEPDLSAYMNKDGKWGAMAVVQTCTSRPAIIKTRFWGYHSHLNLLEIENGWIGWPQSFLSGLEGLDRKLLWFTKWCSALPLQRTFFKISVLGMQTGQCNIVWLFHNTLDEKCSNSRDFDFWISIIEATVDRFLKV